jgi:hypothetical protein
VDGHGDRGLHGINRDTVYATLKRWVEEGEAGLEDKKRGQKGGVRNRLGASVDWRFTTEEARIKLRSLYPSVKED